MAKTYVASIPGGTATTTVQIKAAQTFKTIVFSMIAAAAGSIEISRNAVSQIATAQPTQDVIVRQRLSGTAANVGLVVPISESFKILDNIYIHCTGAGNVGEVTFI